MHEPRTMTEGNSLLLRYHGPAVIFLLCIASFLRFYKPEEYPLLINQDELSNIYDGYSFAETGNDRSAESYYVVVRGFGSADHRPALMPWLLAGVFKVFGYSVLKGRIFAAVLGMISLVLLYFFSKKISGKDFALVVLALATFSPWHLIFSRMVHEGTMLPSVFLLGTLLIWKRSREKKFPLLSLALLGFVTGFSVNAYQATRLTGLLLAMFIGLDVIFTIGFRKSFSRIAVWILMTGIGALPQLIFLFERSDLFFMRSKSSMPAFTSFGDYLNVIRNLFVDLNPVYLFFSSGKPNVFTVARFLPVEAPFFIIGLFLLKRVINKNVFRPFYIYVLVFIALIPAAITLDNPHDLRVSSFMILAPMISSAGIISVLNFFKSVSVQRIIFCIILLSIIINAAIFIRLYSQSYELRNVYQQHDLVVLAEKVSEQGKDCSKVFIEDVGNQPSIYIAVFTGMSPKEFQTANKAINTSWIWDLYKQLGRFYFQHKEEINTEFLRPSADKRLLIYSERRTDQLPVDSVLTEELGWMYFYKR